MAEGVEVGTGVVSIFPVMGSIGKALDKELGKSAGSVQKAGKAVGTDFGKAISTGAADGMDDAEKQIKSLTNAVEASTTKVERAREKEADASRQVEIATESLNEAREKGAKNSALLRAEDRLEKAKRSQRAASGELTRTEKLLESQQRDLAEETQRSARSAKQAGDDFGTMGQKTRRGLKGAASVLGRFSKTAKNEGEKSGERFAGSFKEASDKGFDKIKGGLKAGLVGMAAGAGAAAGGAFMASFGAEAASDKVAAQLGLNSKQQARVKGVSGSVFSGGYGESREDVNTAVVGVMSSLPGASKKSSKWLQQVTQDALNLSQAFEIDVARSTQVVGQMMRTGLAKDANEGMDLLTASLQDVPVNLRDDLLDAIDEYGPFFKQMGLSGAEAMGMLTKGAEQGMYGIDKTGDAIKEFTIRATDLSTATKDAYSSMGLNAQQMTNDLLAGGATASKATGQIIDGLLGIKDPGKQAEAAIALFGTPIEDLSTAEIPKFLQSMKSGTNSLKDFGGASKEMGDTLRGNATTRIKQFKRTVQTGLINLVGNHLIPALSKVGGWLKRAFESPEAQAALADLKRAGRQLLPVLTQFGGKLLEVGRQYMPVIMDAARQVAAAFRRHMPAVKQAVGAVGDLILEIARTVVPILRRFLPPAIKIFSYVFGFIIRTIKNAAKIIGGLLKIIRGIFTGDFRLIRKGVTQIFGAMWDQVENLLRSAYKIGKLLLTRYVKFWWGIGTRLGNGMIKRFTKLWSWVHRTFFGWWTTTTGLIKKPIDKALNWLGRVFGPGGFLRTTFSKAVDAVARIWSKIEAKAKKPVKFIIETVINNGLIKAVNWIADKLGMGKDGQWIKPVSIPGFRTGGPTGNIARNKVAGVVHGNEHVVTAEEVASTPGGHKTWAKLRNMASAGILPGYRGGGQVQPVPGHGNRHSGYSWATWAGDFPNPTGTPVRAWKDGIVAAVKYLTTSYGQHVRMNHTDGTSSLYAHLSRIGVKVGEALKAGDILGRVGSTGNSTGPHLHFETMGGPYKGGGNVISNIFNWGKDKLGNLISGAADFFKNRLPDLSPLNQYGRFGELLKGIPGKLVSGATDWATSKVGSMASPGGTGVERWRGHVMRALGMVGLPITDPYISAWLRQIKSESGGNPSIVQGVHDVNSGGNEARGLVQVIPGTFAAYRSRALPNDRTNPLANLFAGMNYAMHRYGRSGMLGVIGHGHGYARGTQSALPGVALVGERGPELVHFRGGEKVTPNHGVASAMRELRGSAASVSQRDGDVYVQNPWGPEYMRAETATVADGRIRRTANRMPTARKR